MDWPLAMVLHHLCTLKLNTIVKDWVAWFWLSFGFWCLVDPCMALQNNNPLVQLVCVRALGLTSFGNVFKFFHLCIGIHHHFTHDIGAICTLMPIMQALPINA